MAMIIVRLGLHLASHVIGRVAKLSTKVMSAKAKKPAAATKKLSTRSLSKTLTEPALLLPEVAPTLSLLDQLRKKPVTSQDLLEHYDYLSIQLEDSFYLIEAIKSNSQEAIL